MTDVVESLVIQGQGIGHGCAVAPVFRFTANNSAPRNSDAPPHDENPQTAIARTMDAIECVASDLNQHAHSSDGDLRNILLATVAIARDPALADDISQRITDGQSPTSAVEMSIEHFATMFSAAGGPLSQRVTDLYSVRDRVVSLLDGRAINRASELTIPSVICAEDLSPADTAALNVKLVRAIVTEQGGTTGHTAIIAAQRGIPCVVRAPGSASLADGTLVAVDAYTGSVIVHPTDEQVSALLSKAHNRHVATKSTAPGATQDGHAVALLANIGTSQDATDLSESAAQGVGLFRTEVLFFDSSHAPSRHEQLPHYRFVAEQLGERKVVIRTLDAGADKPLSFAHHDIEENPALGVRGYRLVRTMPELLEEQLAALGTLVQQLPTNQRDRIWVMAPMISTSAEATHFARLARAHGIERVGVMIEVPAAALRAHEIMRDIDFVSIGSNDLAQYTMAADRMHTGLSDLLDAWQPAVLDLIAATCEAGKRQAKPVGVCGESAADPLMALVLTGLGVSSLSMSPDALPLVRWILSRHTIAQCQDLAAAARNCADAESARNAVWSQLDQETRSFLM
ncbi:phosphoenolpyruvate--protein phosphotransferase [Jonesia quinghaiensis]|uniref:phosphoenolpyruvate--protein phosphotransferase n=1 Tax=Jonesia quinghaiensis TaxID=262806 RepID=UPI00040A7E12|nr:phosphoenolpyruvate--protein phosphotransferase [Jonesia quinghaiensis]